MQKGVSHFKTFPEFTKLTLDDRELYERLTSRFPTTIHYSFPALMMWWGVIDDCLVSELNGSLVFSFWVPGMEDESGLGILGDQKIDETICELLDYMKKNHKAARLVHVPDFSLKSIKYPDLFKFTSEPDYDEPIVDIKDFASFDNLPSPRRSAVRRLFSEVNEEDVRVEPIDIDNPAEKQLLNHLVDAWEPAGPLNNYAKYEIQGLHGSIADSERLGFSCIGMYVKGELHSFLLYEHVEDKHVNMGYLRLSYDYPHMIDLALYQYSKWLQHEGAVTANLDSDMGIEVLRTLKLSLGASKYRRFFTVTPAKDFKPV